MIEAGSKPQGRASARSSSTIGAGPLASAGRTTSMNQDHSPSSASSSAAVKAGSPWCSASSKASLAPRPATAACSAAGSAIPANQSSPVAPYGAGPEALTAASTRSGSRAAQASACGPPPEWPMTANRSIPSASTTAATSAAAEPTGRSGRGVEPP